MNVTEFGIVGIGSKAIPYHSISGTLFFKTNRYFCTFQRTIEAEISVFEGGELDTYYVHKWKRMAVIFCKKIHEAGRVFYHLPIFNFAVMWFFGRNINCSWMGAGYILSWDQFIIPVWKSQWGLAFLGLATNSIFFCLLFVKYQCFALTATSLTEDIFMVSFFNVTATPFVLASELWRASIDGTAPFKVHQLHHVRCFQNFRETR